MPIHRAEFQLHLACGLQISLGGRNIFSHITLVKTQTSVTMTDSGPTFFCFRILPKLAKFFFFCQHIDVEEILGPFHIMLRLTNVSSEHKQHLQKFSFGILKNFPLKRGQQTMVTSLKN